MKRSSPGEDFLRQAFFVDHRTKSSLAKEFGCTIPVVNRWLKEAGIQLEPHFGRKLNVDEERFRQDVGTMRMSELKLKYECSHSGIKGLCRRLGVDPPKKTSDDWKEGTELIAKKLDWIKDQNTNHGRTIESLADELNAHVTKILRILRTDGYDVRIQQDRFHESRI